jgi:branched-chain amino acid transport system permease protein
VSGLLFVQMFITGIIMGLIYTLSALGITLIFGVMRVVNLVHAELTMLSAFFMYYLFEVWHINFFLSLILCAIAISLLGLFLQRYLYKPLRYELLNVLIIATGAGIALRSLGWIVFGPLARDISTVFPGMIRILGTPLSMERAAVALICLGLTIGLYIFLYKTKTGKSLRAVEQDSEAAAVLGIRIDRVYMIVFIVSCILAAVAGAFTGMLFAVEPEMGSEPLMKCIMIIMIGGMGSIPGAILAGLLLGLIDSFSETLFGGEMAYIISFALLMLVLIIRPRGFFGYQA